MPARPSGSLSTAVLCSIFLGTASPRFRWAGGAQSTRALVESMNGEAVGSARFRRSSVGCCAMSLFTYSKPKGRPPYSELNIASPAFKANPFPFYARLRAEAPAYRMTLPTKESAWLITRYDDVVTVLKDERFVKDTINALTPGQMANQRWFRTVFKSLKRNMLNRDPPDHTRLRGLVARASLLPRGSTCAFGKSDRNQHRASTSRGSAAESCARSGALAEWTAVAWSGIAAGSVRQSWAYFRPVTP